MKLNLLPNYFKRVALIVVLFTIALIIFTKISNLNVSYAFLKHFTKASLALAGYFLIMAKEKIEDEFIQSARLRAFAASFLLGAGIYIIRESQVLYFISSSGDTLNPFELIFNEMLVYLFIFYSIKTGKFRFEKSSKGNKGAK